MLLTQLSRLYPSSRLYILDIKLRDFNDWPGRVMDDNVPPRPGRNERIQVWQPVVLLPEKIEEWLFNIRHDSPAYILIDEVSALNYGSRNTSPEFTKITKLGRGLPVGTISHTQELVDIPRGILSQPDHIARFRLKRRYDKNLANQMMTELDTGLKEPHDKYGFWYSYAEKDGEPIYYPDAQTFLGLGKRSI